MKIIVDWDLCQGHGACMGEAPELFRVDDKGAMTVLQEAPSESLREQAKTAAQYCPTGAIRIEG
jgi:ferredoxin